MKHKKQLIATAVVLIVFAVFILIVMTGLAASGLSQEAADARAEKLGLFCGLFGTAALAMIWFGNTPLKD
jgi:preprotein translocase subunit SecY